MKLLLFASDLQVPYQDHRYVKALERFIRDVKPHKVYQVGDLIDSPEVGRWSKGSAGEYAGTFQGSLDQSKRIIERLSITGLQLGNHDLRVEEYVRKYAPALMCVDSLRLESLLGLENLGCELYRRPQSVAPGWIMAHGHEGGLSQIAGRTAYGLGEKFGKSVVCGHTHRAGVVSTTTGFGGKYNILTGMEVGHGMRLGAATYMKHTPNWQVGFGLLWVDGQHVTPQLVTMDSACSFVFDGVRFKP